MKFRTKKPGTTGVAARVPECHPSRRHEAGGLCKACYVRKQYRENRDRMNRNSMAWARRNPEQVKAIRLKYRYGVTLERVKAMLAEQEGLCAICRKRPATDVDHSHSTGAHRGMLCGRCNRALGLMQDDPETLERAAAYLRA